VDAEAAIMTAQGCSVAARAIVGFFVLSRVAEVAVIVAG
jgi:hypothetical protein